MFTVNARVQDILKRSAKTFTQSFLGAIAAAHLAGQEITVSILGAAVVAGLAAVFSAIWNATVKQI